jgi:type VI secretion system secreted protein VgrG
VAQMWSGKSFGGFQLPRMGDEVVVEFLEGNPDRPLVTGRVYNGDNAFPYALPAEQTKSGLKSRSSKSGTAENFNELRFEDKKGDEEIYFHAEKNFKRVVENDDTLEIGLEKKNPGNQTITVHKDRTATIKTGNETLEVSQGNRKVTIKMGNDQLEVSMGNQTTAIKMGKSETTAMQSIELKVGGNSIKIDQSGITIKGIMVKVEGSATADLKAPEWTPAPSPRSPGDPRGTCARRRTSVPTRSRCSTTVSRPTRFCDGCSSARRMPMPPSISRTRCRSAKRYGGDC